MLQFAGISFEFEVNFLYIGSDIILMIDSSSDGIFCCQLDQGTCIRCKLLLIKMHNRIFLNVTYFVVRRYKWISI